MLLSALSMREHDAGGAGNLVVIKLAEVLHIHLTLACIGNGGVAVKAGSIGFNALYSADNVGKLANSRGLDNHSVRSEIIKHLSKRGGKITDE